MISYVNKITNDLNEMVYIGTTTRPFCKRISDHRYNAIKRGNTSKLYAYMREIDVERFKIVCVREYKDISKERLKSKEEKYIIKNGLNMHSMRILLYSRQIEKVLYRVRWVINVHSRKN
jgi:hypothetical protein